MIDWRPAAPAPAPASVFEVVHGHARARPERVALVHVEPGRPDERVTYAALVRDALALASGLVERGLRGKPVGLLFPPGTEFVATILATMAAGAVAVPIPPAGRRRERASGVLGILRDCGAVHLIAPGGAAGADDLHDELRRGGVDVMRTGDLAAGASGRPLAGPRADDLAVLQYTSGSTSRPKGVELRHAAILANEAMIQAAFGHDDASTVVGWTPHFHDQGLFGNVVQPLYVGATYVLFSPATFLRNPLFWLENISRFRARTAGGPNFAYDLCVKHLRRGPAPEVDLSSWRVAYNGAEPIRSSSLRAFAAAFAPYGFAAGAFLPCYGLAECTLFTAGRHGAGPAPWRGFDALALAEGRVQPAAGGAPATEIVSCGPPAPGAEIAIVDPAGAPAAPGRVGEILVGGPHVAAGYWGRPQETKRVFGAAVPGRAGRFLRTGDLGFFLDGELYVTGRLKDLIIVRGRNVYPHDVEQACEGACDVLAANGSAAFGVEGDEPALVLVAEVVRERRDRVDVAAVGKTLRAAVLAALEVGLTDVVLVAPGAVPKTTSGKVKRAAARALLLAGELPVIGATGSFAAGLRERSENRDVQRA